MDLDVEAREGLEIFFKGKEKYYKWMSDMFLFPPNKEQIESYCDLLNYIGELSDEPDSSVSCAYAEMESVASKYKAMTPEQVTEYMNDLNRNYTYIFCFGKLTPVTESVYTSASGLNNEADIDGIEAMYAQSGYKANTQGSNEPSDHIGVELGFLADLNFKCRLFLEKGNVNEVKKGLTIEKQFFEKHILNWIKMFCDNVRSRQEVTIYYRPLMNILETFVKEDYESLSELLKRW